MSVPPKDKDVTSRDEAYWAKPVSHLHAPSDLPAEAVNLNVEGRRLAGLTGGFGRMWQKTYLVPFDGVEVSPEGVVAAWKENFPSFWLKGNRFYGALTGISPGDVGLLNLSMGAVKLSTGILVVYADETSFSFMTPEGHMFHGMITFSAQVQDGRTWAQVQALIRAQDPLYELGMAFGGHRKEDRFWSHTLRALAEHFGVEQPQVEVRRVCVDKRRQWSNWRNVRHNAAIRSGLHMLGAPGRAVAKPFRRGSRTES